MTSRTADDRDSLGLPQATTDQAGRPWWVAVVLLSVVIVPPLYAQAARQIYKTDPIVLAQAARDVLSGKRLYSQAWAAAPPLGILIYALPQLAMPHAYGAIAYFCGLCLVAAGTLLAYTFRAHLAASAASLLFVTLYPLTNWDFAWPSTELFACLPVAATLSLATILYRARTVSPPRCVLAGALVGLTFHIAQTTALCGLVPATAVLVAAVPIRQKLSGLLGIVGGILLAGGAVLALVAWLGGASDYAWTVFRLPREQLRFDQSREFFNICMTLCINVLPFLLAAFATLALTRDTRWLVATVAAVAVFTAVLPLDNYGHFWVNSFPYVALLIGLGLERLRRLDPRLAGALATGLALALVPATALQMATEYSERSHDALAAVAQAVDELAPEDATLLVSGPNPSEAIQFASRLAPAHDQVWMFQMQSPWTELLRKRLQDATDEYVATPPDVLVIDPQYRQVAMQDVPTGSVPEVLQLVRRLLKRYDYRLQGAKNGYEIMLRQ